MKTAEPKFQLIPTPDGFAEAVRVADRPIVVVEINGTNIPFYVSTGHGNKENVAEGKWYPFFGIGPDEGAWFNKGPSTDEISNYYGNKDFKNVAQHLDMKLGDIREHPALKELPTTGPHIDAINRDLNPTKRGQLFYLENIKNTLDAVKIPPKEKLFDKITSRISGMFDNKAEPDPVLTLDMLENPYGLIHCRPPSEYVATELDDPKHEEFSR